MSHEASELHDIQSELSILFDRITDIRDYQENTNLANEIDDKLISSMDTVLFNIEALNDDIDGGAYNDDKEDYLLEEED